MTRKPSIKQSIAYYLTQTDAVRCAFFTGLFALATLAVMAGHTGTI